MCAANFSVESAVKKSGESGVIDGEAPRTEGF